MTKEILNEREKDYGQFEDNAEIAQGLKAIAESGIKWEWMEDDQREAIHMICSKISRIVTCNYNHVDSWEDIAGYATLVADRLEGESIIHNGVINGMPIGYDVVE